jgi:chaperone BCS1
MVAEICDPDGPLAAPLDTGGLGWLSPLSWLFQLFEGDAITSGADLGSIGGDGAEQGSAKQPTSLLGTLCLLILPALLSSMLRGVDGHAYSGALWLSRKLRGLVFGEEYTRTLVHSVRYNRWGYAISDSATDDDRNSILQKALTLHIAALEPGLDFPRSRVALTKRVESEQAEGYDSDDETTRGSVAAQLKKFEVSMVRACRRTASPIYAAGFLCGCSDSGFGQRQLPPPGEMVVVQQSPQVEFSTSIDTKKQGGSNSGGGMTTVNTTFTLRSRAPRADLVVSAFIGTAYTRYVAQMKEHEQQGGRHMYTPLPKSDGHWKRYKLSDEKSFETLFFPQKAQLLRLLAAFEQKSGKFAIPGCAPPPHTPPPP